LLKSNALPCKIVEAFDSKILFSESANQLVKLCNTINLNMYATISVDYMPSNSMKLHNILHKYRKYEAYSIQEPKSNGRNLIIASVIMVLLGVVCSSSCSVHAKASLYLLFIPAGFFFLLSMLKRSQHKRDIARNENLQEAFLTLKELVNNLSGTAPTNEDICSIAPTANLYISMNRIRTALLNTHIDYGLQLLSSESMKILLDTINQQGDFCTMHEFMVARKTLHIHYDYMKTRIVTTGKSVINGEKIPSRYKETKIRLLRCPSCGGPLANDGRSECYYCGSKFAK